MVANDVLLVVLLDAARAATTKGPVQSNINGLLAVHAH